MFDWIAFDADDTLWKNEEIYLQGKNVFLDILSDYDIDQNELETDDEYVVENIQYYGYGAMSFVLSMIEKAIELIGESIHPKDIQRLIDFGKHMLTAEVEVFDGVPLLLQNLSKDYPLLLITKGDLFHQQRKLEASGLAGYFRLVEVVSEKSPEVYSEILERHQIDPGRVVMIGNSLRSDIIPVLKLGAWAIYLSDHLTWSHEDDPLDVIAQDNYLEVKEISGVLQAIKLLGK
ncbi:MAG: HAD family hydrolase [Anaerolineales bacterium]